MHPSLTDLAVVIPLIFAGIASVIAAYFAGMVALRQLPAQKAAATTQTAKIDEVQKIVNGNYSAQADTIAQHVATIAELRAQLNQANATALTKAEARAAPPPPPAQPGA